MAKRTNKTAMINARVTRRMKQQVLLEAENRGETEAMIVREALKEYFERRGEDAGGRQPIYRVTRPELLRHGVH